MNARIEALAADAESWPVEERLRLVELVLSTLNRADPVIDAEWAEECEGRLAAYERGETMAREASEVLGKYTKR